MISPKPTSTMSVMGRITPTKMMMAMVPSDSGEDEVEAAELSLLADVLAWVVRVVALESGTPSVARVLPDVVVVVVGVEDGGGSADEG